MILGETNQYIPPSLVPIWGLYTYGPFAPPAAGRPQGGEVFGPGHMSPYSRGPVMWWPYVGYRFLRDGFYMVRELKSHMSPGARPGREMS